MDFSFFIKGLVFGFSIALPVGPIGILCIQRSLSGGWAAGLLSGMGAATADAIYGSLAAFGLTGITALLVGQRTWIQILGGLFLCYLGLRTFLSDPQQKAKAKSSDSATKGYLSALALTLTNPMTILSFMAVFAGMGLAGTHAGRMAPGWLVAGVFCGSMAWWIILASASTIFKTRLNRTVRRAINWISGIVLSAFGLTAIFTGI